MRAIVQHAYGTPEMLKLETVPTPRYGPDEVLIRVRASSINHADLVYTTGRPLIARLAFGVTRPKAIIRGKDVAGVVEAVGSNVTQFAPGDEIYGELVAGAFAEYAVARVERLALKPANLTFDQAGTVPLAGMTALQGLRDAGAVKPAQSVLINGASGGVGTFAVQIAKALGATVTGVASSRHAALVRRLGADHVIEYENDDFTIGRHRYDVIFDLVGNHSFGALRGVLTRQGTLVLSSGTGGAILGPMLRILRATATRPFVTQTLTLFSQNGTSATLADLRDLIERGEVFPSIDSTHALADTAAALRHFTSHHPAGKISISNDQ